MPWLKIRAYTGPVFDGLLAISPNQYPAEELGGAVSETFTPHRFVLPIGQRITDFGWSDPDVVVLSAADRSTHQSGASQVGTVRRIVAAPSVDLNQAAPTIVNWGSSEYIDEGIFTETSATQTTVLVDGIYRLWASITGIKNGGQDFNILGMLFINGGSGGFERAFHGIYGDNDNDAMTLKIFYEGPLSAGDVISFAGVGLGLNGADFDTGTGQGLFVGKILGAS